MTIGKNSRKSSLRSSIRAPKFLDKSSGFYGRLDEPEVTGEVEEERCNREEGVVVDKPGVDEREEAEVFNEGMMESDGETLLSRKPSRRSSRWRRSTRRKQKEEEKPVESPADAGVVIQVEDLEKAEDVEKVVHFPVREHEDDQVLIRDKKRGREEAEEEDEEGEEERRMRKEQEEGMKAVKRNTVKNYRKALDRAFRRGWETFIANLYSVTLTPVTSSSPQTPSSPSTKKKILHKSAMVECR